MFRCIISTCVYIPIPFKSLWSFGWEHVIVFDGVEPQRYEHPQRTTVHIEKSKGDHGKSPQNIGIIAARGEFITILDDDNEWLPNHLECMMKPFETDPEVQIVFCPLTMIHYNNGNFREERHFSISQGKVDAGNWIARKELLLKHGLFWAPHRRSYDWEMLKKIFTANGKYIVIPERTFLYFTPKP